MIQVFNVGQGDSFLLHPDFRCNFDKTPLLIDCGPKKAKVASKIKLDEIDVLITHSHKDHIGGLKDISSKIRKLYIPYFLPEVWRIFNFLKKYLFNNILDVDLINGHFEKVIVVGEGDKLCDHLQIFNPPKSGNDIFNKYELNVFSINEALRLLNRYGIKIPYEDEIINYQSVLADIDNLSFLSDQNISSYSEVARKYVHNFFISLADSLSEYENTVNIDVVITHIRNKFQSLIHQSCIVFKYEYEGKGSFLFTGDADEYVFDRMINQGWNITSDYLKVPHHGSRENLSLELVKKINPKTAVFSHKNGIFGRAKDPHPHNEVLDYCTALKVEMRFTNDVKKGTTTLYPATTGVIDGFIDFKQP